MFRWQLTQVTKTMESETMGKGKLLSYQTGLCCGQLGRDPARDSLRIYEECDSELSTQVMEE